MSQGPWSVKGIDPKARSIARDRAQRQGVTLGQYLNSLLLDDEDGPIADVRLEDRPVSRPAGSAETADLQRMSSEIDALSQRLEVSQARSARAVAGLDKSILGLMSKVETSAKAQLTALERVTRAMGEIESAQTALRTRIDALESEERGGAALEGLKTLEASLARLAETVQERAAQLQQDQSVLRSEVEEKVGRVSDRFEDFTRSMDQTVTNAVRSNSAQLSGRIDQIEQQVSAAERRMEGALGRITDAAARFEAIETKSERAITDSAWRMERALESNLSRSRQMSKELLDRVDGIEEKTREAVNNLSDAVARITDRVARAERKTETAIEVLERSVNEIDSKMERQGARSASDDFAQLQSLFQKRLDSLAEDLSRPIHAVRADVERRLEEAVRSGSAAPEKIERLERMLRQLQDQVEVSESRQADAVEAMSAQVERLSKAVDERLRAVEARGDARSIEDVRREMLRLADTIDARITSAEAASRSTADALRSDMGRLNTSVDDRLQALEKRSASAIDAVGEQVSLVAERLQRRHDEGLARLSARIDEASSDPRQLDPSEIDRLADRLDERVRESERRSAEAIGQIGEQVARVADRLQNQHQESLRALESRLSESGREHEARLADALADMNRRMDEIGEQSSSALAPVHKTISSLARRLESVEDAARTQSALPPAVDRDIPAIADDYVILDDLDAPPASPNPAALASVEAEEADDLDIVGVEPPPFDRLSDVREADLFSEEASKSAPESVQAEPARNIDDLLDTDDVLLAPASEESAPANAPERQSYLDIARRAARENRRDAGGASSGRRSLGRGPLLGAAALAVAVAGGSVMTVMRGKQDAKPDDFAKLDPAAPAPAKADSAGVESVLFSEAAAAADPAADLLETPQPAVEDEPAVTLADAVREGDPVALYDYALELLQTGEKARAVQLLKEAADGGLVMAEYRLAKLYEKGEGAPRDMAAARSWTEKAAIGGNKKAMHDLAVFYAEGDAGPQSYAAAVEWFRQAADLGLVDSQYNLAVLYEQGLGLTQDPAEAAYWFEVASRAGDQDAGRRARQLLSEMQPTQAEQIRRRARAFNPKPAIPGANGDFGRRAWDTPTQADIAELRRLLERQGYAPGPAGDRSGTRLSEAIRAFERDHDLPVTGEASVTLLRQVRASNLNTFD